LKLLFFWEFFKRILTSFLCYGNYIFLSFSIIIQGFTDGYSLRIANRFEQDILFRGVSCFIMAAIRG
ncbi:MAG TPA: hypothetical protein VK469_12035, partial [Candidatus Kapabacteria bacterium]|nr:hypothetical protein [Candidatus Kapabacteria bacterium]